MILQIDGIYFNPLTIRNLSKRADGVLIYFDDNDYLVFKDWKMHDLAARINELILDFHRASMSPPPGISYVRP